MLVGVEQRLCELVDGVLVDTPVGYYASFLAVRLTMFLGRFVDEHDLGIVLGADATLRLAPGLVRLPDVSFISWDRFPGRRLPPRPIADLTPDLAVEVLSPSNTEREMTRKLQEYFRAGCRLVCYVLPKERAVRVYSDPTNVRTLHDDDVLGGGAGLPGFRLAVDRDGSRHDA